MLNGSKSVDKIRVGFIVHLSDDWIGGVNYFRNLLNLIHDNEDLNIEPVLFLTSYVDEKLLRGYPDVEIVKKDKLSITRWFYKRMSKIFHKELYWEYMVRKYHIDVLSHCVFWVRNVKVISWIQDFQHKYLADLFTPDEVEGRDRGFAQIADRADAVILSSNDAKKDFVTCFPMHENKAYVYRFVVPIESFDYDSNELRLKYKLEGKFYYIPNQFWQHKNHRVVLEALKYLRDSSKGNIKIVCSGNTNDYRNTEYFARLMEFVNKYNLSNQFIVLGKIPYADVQALMRECHALINPSLFEGWSTMVEEAKSMGKAIILSDLNVHKEQNPEGGVFFRRHDYCDLAAKMLEVWGWDDMIMRDLQKNAAYLLKKRERDAAYSYRMILENTLKS